MAKVLMVQGTMSNVGKSLLTAGLCRIFKQDGYRVAPFKSQNMALNSFITKEGLEMGRAQVMQAEAAGIEPEVRMNPILLKPTNDLGSQVIVNGEVFKTMSARDYFAYKKNLIPIVKDAFESLSNDYDIVVIEGAGSPAEINLKQEDLVNMGMAKMAKAPVLLVGDIDRGGVFAQLLGTVSLLEPEEQSMVKGLIINKFRGDKTILEPGVKMLEERANIPVVGVTPYLSVDIEDEDSLSQRLDSKGKVGLIDIAVIRLPRISNFTDFNALEIIDGVSLRYISSPDELKEPDMIIIPGSKNTISDLLWMRQNGLEAKILKMASLGTIVFGICGGYQMLGESLSDPLGIETDSSGVPTASAPSACDNLSIACAPASSAPSACDNLSIASAPASSACAVKGMGLLPTDTIFLDGKVRTRVEGKFLCNGGIFECLCDDALVSTGYEIHMGETTLREGAKPLQYITDTIEGTSKTDGAYKGNVFGTYVHGIFDGAGIGAQIIKALACKKGLTSEQFDALDFSEDFSTYKEAQYDLLAEGLRAHLDMDAIYSILNKGL